MKWLGAALVAVLGLGGLAAAAWLGPAAAPRGSPAAIETTPFVAAWDGRSYAYVLPTAHGAILIDTGSDPTGAAVDAALAQVGRSPGDVTAILLTCGHTEHRAAIHHYPNATAYVGQDDIEMARGRKQPRPLLTRLLSLWLGRPPAPQHLAAVLPGSLLQFDGLSVEVIAFPGHSPGSLAFVSGGVAFVGDSLHLTASGVRPALALFDTDPRIGRRAQDRLQDAKHELLADAQFGWRPVLTPTPSE